MSAIRLWNRDRDNPIVRVGFGVVFRGLLDPEQVRELAGLHSEFKDSHPRIKVAAAKGWHLPDQARLPLLEGFTFDNDPKTEEEMRAISLEPLDKDRCALMVIQTDYARWDAMWEGNVQSIFDKCLPKLPNDLKVSRLDISFLNRFIWMADSKEFHLGKILRPDVAKLLSVGISPPGQGHCTFQQSKKDQSTPYAPSGTIAIRVGPPEPPYTEGELWVDLLLDQRQDTPEGSAGLTGKDLTTNGTLDKEMVAMHDRCRETLALLLSEDMRSAINLGG